MIVAIYSRVSTDKQDADKQEEMITNFANRQEYIIYKYYKDICSGKKDKRPQFNILLQDMRMGCFDAIVVYDLTRIGRSLNHLLQLFEEFDNRGIKFISMKENFDTTTPTGKLMLRMLMLLAEWQREIIASSIKDRLQHYKKQLDEKGYYITKDGKKKTTLGRPEGSGDKKRRKLSGYHRRWAED